MDSAAAIIDLLNARAAQSGRLREAARASWRLWLDRLAERPGRVTGASAQALVGEMAARPLPAPPPRAAQLGRWRAFATLWRQHWHIPSGDEPSWRWTAGSVSFVGNVLMGLALFWLTAWFVLQPKPGDEDAMRVEYIGIGTPDVEGGGTPPAPAASVDGATPAAAAASAAPAPSVARVQPPAAQGSPPPEQPAPVPDAAAPPAEPAASPQPLATTTPVSPEPPVFELPPTTPPVTGMSVETIAPIPPVRVVDIPEPVRGPPPPAIAPTIDTGPLRAPVPAVPTRDVTVVQAPALSVPTPAPVEAPVLRAPVPGVASRDVRAPAASGTAPAGAAPRAAPSPSTTPAGAAGDAAARTPAGPAGVAPGSTGVGAGPRPTPAPGSWATPRRDDDWGESTANRPGRGDGLRGNDGRPHVGEPPGSAAPGRPPGTVTEAIADIDRAGTWLKRAPNDYEPTAFDRYWRPHETLLEEWVRRGYKEVSIPIPGSKRKIICGISILQLGGGCMVRNPDVNAQATDGRPPPDVPFKPELQEGNGALPPGAGPPPGG